MGDGGARGDKQTGTDGATDGDHGEVTGLQFAVQIVLLRWCTGLHGYNNSLQKTKMADEGVANKKARHLDGLGDRCGLLGQGFRQLFTDLGEQRLHNARVTADDVARLLDVALQAII